MKLPRPLFTWALMLLMGLATGMPSKAQDLGVGPRGQDPMAPRPLPPGVKATFVHLGSGVPAVLYEPAAPGARSHIGFFVMHADGDYLSFSACTELSKRGYRVLCANNSTDKSGVFNDGMLDRVLLEAKLAVAYLRRYPGVEKVVLFGHSGGATIMTAYQDIAENGVKVCQGSEKIHKCPDSLAGLPPADGMILADANWGQAEMTLLSIDPAVENEETGEKLNPDLDLFSQKNGYSKAGANYSPEFIRRFQAAQGKRNNDLIKSALQRVSAIDAGKGRFSDDEPFMVPGASFIGFNNKMFPEETRLLSHTRKAWPLLHADGSSDTEIVHSVRVPEGTMGSQTAFFRGALKTSVHNFLSSYAVRVNDDFRYTEDGVYGVDWTSTYASPPGNVEGITVPLLVMGMTGHWEYLAAELIHDNAKSTDKSIAFVEGATHMYTTCKQCEKYPGQFGDTEKTTYDYVDGWTAKAGRFASSQK